MALRVLFTSHPLAGHLNPLIRYATGLRDAGHHVRVASREPVRATLEKHGLDFVCLPEVPEDAMVRAMALLDASRGRDGIAVALRELFGSAMSQSALPRIEAEIESWRPNLIVRETTEFAGLVAAEKFDIPSVCVGILASSCVAEYASEIAEVRATMRRFAGLSGRPCGEPEPVLTAFPAAIDAEETVLGARPVRIGQSDPPVTPVVGDESWLPDAGETLLYLTFGTVAGRSDKAQAAYRMALDVVADMPLKVLLTTGPVMNSDLLEPIPSNVVIEGYVPQSKVFSAAALIVHHGGAGTTLGALAAGLPQVIVPLFADHPFNAKSIAAAGAGISVEHDDPNALNEAIQIALESTEIRASCSAIAAEMAETPGVPFAIETLERLAR